MLAALLYNGFGGKPRRDADYFHPGKPRRQTPEEMQWRLNLMLGVMKRASERKPK